MTYHQGECSYKLAEPVSWRFNVGRVLILTDPFQDKRREAKTNIEQYQSILIDVCPVVIGQNITVILSTNHSKVNRC